LWNRFNDHYHPSTTIMFDDLRRNFILNKKQGLVIKPFRRATTSGRSDEEFLRLKPYMAVLAGLDSFDDMDHDNWKRFLSAQAFGHER
jgi:ubiquitin-like domain-containing CTD phosphatase 1